MSTQVTPDTDPWITDDAVKAAVLTATHMKTLAYWEKLKTPRLAQGLVDIADERETHKHDTGWIAQYEGNDVWTFTYNDPSTREREARAEPLVFHTTVPEIPTEESTS